jgi:two-component system OmpR family response regulator
MIQVLVLDDESELREEVAFFLRARVCTVTEAGSIREFRNAVVLQDYDIFIIDRKLPDGDGLDLVTDLRSQGVRSGIVVFSARDACTDRIEGYQRLADHYVTKPVRLTLKKSERVWVSTGLSSSASLNGFLIFCVVTLVSPCSPIFPSAS